MADAPRHVILNANQIPGGTFASPWRRSDRPGAYFSDIEHYIDIARTAERGKLDAFFIADSGGFRDKDWIAPGRLLDPAIAIAHIAAHTTHIGLIATATTSYSDPYNLARRFASLADITRGRVAWNFVVTSQDDAVAKLYSQTEAATKEERYARADEFVGLVLDLWKTWDPDAIVADKATGEYVSRAKQREVNFVGKHFQVSGILKAPPPKYGRPLLVQAGASTYGVELAGKYSDAVYASFAKIDEARARRIELDQIAQRYGRAPGSVKFLPGLILVAGDTEAAARRKDEELHDLIPLDYRVKALSVRLGLPLDHLDPNGPLPWDEIEKSERLKGERGHIRNILAEAKEKGLTIAQATREAPGHANITGSDEQIADFIEEWFTSGAVDGFNVLFGELPGDLEIFVDHVVPRLQRKGLFRTDYEGTTLASHYGLEV